MADTPPTANKGSKQRRRLTGPGREDLRHYAATAYQGGDSIRTICAATSRSYGLIYGLLTESEVTMRPRGATARPETETASAPAATQETH